MCTCAGEHNHKNCQSNIIKCVNCGKPHKANSKECEKIKATKQREWEN
jgi:hypothetical protein